VISISPGHALVRPIGTATIAILGAAAFAVILGGVWLANRRSAASPPAPQSLQKADAAI